MFARNCYGSSYGSMVSSYFRRSDAILLVYDVQNLDSFRKVRQWMCTIEVRPCSRNPM